ncbi:hypothetical protein RJ55_04851 [Drechmeria coniospora]|nr:hypothetical protein RJ55_04851 [Drechmeria coniospora]
MATQRLPSTSFSRIAHKVLVPQVRRLSIHQHQSLRLLAQSGAPVPRGRLVRTVTEAKTAIDEFGPGCRITPQLLPRARVYGRLGGGGRCAGQVVCGPEHGQLVASEMLGQGGRGRQDGLVVGELYVTQSVEAASEWYLAMAIDRESCSPTIAISKKGGRDIDVIARDHPPTLFAFPFQLSRGLTAEVLSSIASELSLSSRERRHLERILQAMHGIFSRRDATLLEINPLVRTADERFLCVDANFTFDGAAAGRQAELSALRDGSQEVADELEAERHGLVYVKMDGNIGTVVNGAGLAMATNDAVGFCGGASANFLDAGGKATEETMQKAFAIVTRDPTVRAILVNIYGGITRCDMIAASILGASRQMDMRVPMVVRLQGTNAERGLKMLEAADLGLHVESDFGRAAQLVVELANATVVDGEK